MSFAPLSNIRVPTCTFLKEGDIVFGKKRYDSSGNGRLESSARPCCNSHPIKNELVLTFIRKRCIFTNMTIPRVLPNAGAHPRIGESGVIDFCEKSEVTSHKIYNFVRFIKIGFCGFA